MKRINFYEIENEKMHQIKGGDDCQNAGCFCSGDVSAMNDTDPGQTKPLYTEPK